METLALSTILVPLVGALLCVLLPRGSTKGVAQLFAAATSVLVLLLAYQFHISGIDTVHVKIFAIENIEIFGLVIDKVSTLIAAAVVFIGFLIAVYSGNYMSDKNREHPGDAEPRYYGLLLAFIGAMAGLVLSSTLLGQLLFFEVTGVCSWSLIGYYQSKKSQNSGLKALLITHVASIGLFLATAAVFVETGTLSVSALAQLSMETKLWVMLGILLAAWGKSAQLPLHVWLPDAMSAPTPISAYLHAASMVKVGVYIFARAIMEAGQLPELLGIIGVIGAIATLLYGFVMYLPQFDLKRLLAYSTITQLAYIFLALSLAVFGSDLALEAGITYIFNHAFAKTLFFLVAGCLSYACGTRMLPQIKGLLRKAPLLAVAFCVATLAITGVPPFNGFFSKFPLFAAGFELSDQYSWLMPIMLIGLLESVASFGWLLYWFGKSVLGEPSEAVANMQPLPTPMKAVLVTLIVMSVASSVIAASWIA